MVRLYDECSLMHVVCDLISHSDYLVKIACARPRPNRVRGHLIEHHVERI